MIPVNGPSGKQYRSLSAAARDLGVHISTIRSHLRRYGNLDLVGSWCVPCVWNGRRFSTIRAAANASGFSPSTLIGHLDRYGNLDRLGVGPVGNPGNRSNSKEFRFGSLKWPSYTRAAKDLGISHTSLVLWSGPKASHAQREKLLATIMAYEARQHRRAA